MGLKIVAGLGNPGTAYARTPHNVGFEVLDLLASRLQGAWRQQARLKACLARVRADGAELLLAKPQTYMNLSGEAVGALARFQRVEPAAVLAVVDDIDLPWGKLRLRAQGSDGGHNGLHSLIQHLGTDAFPRLRIGVGRPGGPADVVGHVLGRFTAEEKAGLASLLERATVCVSTACRSGLAAAMNEFNAEPPRPQPPRPPAGPPTPAPQAPPEHPTSS